MATFTPTLAPVIAPTFTPTSEIGAISGAFGFDPESPWPVIVAAIMFACCACICVMLLLCCSVVTAIAARKKGDEERERGEMLRAESRRFSVVIIEEKREVRRQRDDDFIACLRKVTVVEEDPTVTAADVENVRAFDESRDIAPALPPRREAQVACEAVISTAAADVKVQPLRSHDEGEVAAASPPVRPPSFHNPLAVFGSSRALV